MLGGVLDFVEMVVEVADRGLQVVVAEEYLDMADVKTVVQPLFGGEAAQAMQSEMVAVVGCQSGALAPESKPALEGALLQGTALASSENRTGAGEVGFDVECMEVGGEFGEDENLAVFVALAVNAQAALGEIDVWPL